VLHLLAHALVSRNTWWQSENAPRPELKEIMPKNLTAISIHHPDLGEYALYAQGPFRSFSRTMKPTSSGFLGSQNSAGMSRMESMTLSSGE
jgi:hypothetical protein